MEERYWKQFEHSGRIEDYLSFVSSVRQERDQSGSVEEGQPMTAGYSIEGGHSYGREALRTEQMS